LRSPMLEE